MQRLLGACILPRAGLTLAKATHNFHIAEFKNSCNIHLETFACFSEGQVCICNEVALPSRLEWSGFATPIVQDATPHVVDGLNWKAHYVNFAQFFTITDDGLMLHENSFGFAFQQHLHMMDQQEIDQLFLQHFNRLTRSAGAAHAHRDARAALLHRQQQMAQLPAHAPVQLQFKQQMPVQAPVPPPSFPAAGDPQVLQPGASSSSASSSSAIQWQQSVFLQWQQQDAQQQHQVQLTPLQQFPHLQEESEAWKKFWAARAQLKEQQQSV